jgi:16S rRNA (cytosine967-C5)-methyltransferase
MPAAARTAAFRVLRAIASGRADLGDALSRARDPLTDPRDRALATQLATGTLRWRAALDYQLQRLSTKPLARLDAEVLDALRLGAYQLLYLERVPVSAVVNDSVDLVKRAAVGSAAGFVNAVLRRLARERETLSWPDRSNLVEHLAVMQSHPAWLVQRWIDRYGPETAEIWLRFNNQPPSLTLATNRLAGTRDDLAARLLAEQIATAPTAIAPYGLTVKSGRPLASAAFRDGYCLVQDEASQIIPELLDTPRGARVLDACASPGGKTLALAAQCGPDGLVAATDVRRRRVELLAATVRRCRATNVRTLLIGSTSDFPFGDEAFDRVLIDAPCSGLGTVRRDPDIRWRREPADFSALVQAQLDLLRRAGRVVARGGALLYSTCSSEPEENEAVVTAFLRDAADFSVLPVPSLRTSAAIKEMLTPDGYLRTTPGHGLEAFFGAVLWKK